MYYVELGAGYVHVSYRVVYFQAIQVDSQDSQVNTTKQMLKISMFTVYRIQKKRGSLSSEVTYVLHTWKITISYISKKKTDQKNRC